MLSPDNLPWAKTEIVRSFFAISQNTKQTYLCLFAVSVHPTKLRRTTALVVKLKDIKDLKDPNSIAKSYQTEITTQTETELKYSLEA